MVGLGEPPGSGVITEALGISADGSVVVGARHTALDSSAFYWTESLGMVDLGDLLISQGATNVTGWWLQANAVSADGLTIVGFGISPEAPWTMMGQTQAWVATIPEPATGALLLVGAVGCGLLLYRRRAAKFMAK
jgi:probable HAF family extracellular repeat protein